MNTFLIALGSNLGDRNYYIEAATEAIRDRCGLVLARAPLLESAPIGAADQAFINTALLCESALDPEALLAELLRIEGSLGRVRETKWGNRTVDCDIILWRKPDGSIPIYRSEKLVIPHPEAHRRSFVLEPAAAIAGDWIHPVLGLALGRIWAEYPPD